MPKPRRLRFVPFGLAAAIALLPACNIFRSTDTCKNGECETECASGACGPIKIGVVLPNVAGYEITYRNLLSAVHFTDALVKAARTEGPTTSEVLRRGIEFIVVDDGGDTAKGNELARQLRDQGAAAIFRTHYSQPDPRDFFAEVPQIIPWGSAASLASAKNPMVFQTISPIEKAMAAGLAGPVSATCKRVVVAHQTDASVPPAWTRFKDFMRRTASPQCVYGDVTLDGPAGSATAVAALKEKLTMGVATGIAPQSCVVLYGDALTTGTFVRTAYEEMPQIEWFSPSQAQRSSEFVTAATTKAAAGLTFTSYIHSKASADLMRSWFAAVPSVPVSGFDIKTIGNDSFFHGTDALLLLVLSMEVAGIGASGARLRDALLETGKKDGSAPLTIAQIERDGLKATLENIAKSANGTDLPVLDYEGATSSFEFDADNEILNPAGVSVLDAAGAHGMTGQTQEEEAIAKLFSDGPSTITCPP